VQAKSAQVNDRLPGVVWLALLLVIPLVLGAGSVLLGKDMNWDLRNYHYYNAYAFLQHRLNLDIAPAELQTFYNPLLDLPFYWLSTHVPARLVGFILGFAHGYNLALVFLIFWKISRLANRRRRIALGMCTAFLSCVAPGFLSELGNTMNDNVTSLFILGAVLLLLEGLQSAGDKSTFSGLTRPAVAGFVLGLGVGLKPTIGIFALGSAIALFLLESSWPRRWASVVTFGGAGLTGALITGGFWWREMWSRYGNPFLPYFNNLFRSSFIAPDAFLDVRFLPRQLWEYFVWPLVFTQNSFRVSEIKFLDVRFTLLYLISLLWLAVAIRRRRRPGVQQPVNTSVFAFDSARGTFLLVFVLATFILWMLQSSIYRYMIALELLVPTCFLIILGRIVPNSRTQVTVALGAALITLFFFRPFDWGRTAWSDPYFRVDTANYPASEHVTVVMLGNAPMAYVIPEFPPSFRFLRPEGNLVRGDGYGLYREVAMRLKQQSGPVYLLYNVGDRNANPEASSARLGLRLDSQDCADLVLNTPDQLRMCHAQLAGASP
jgi:hypothetical protein